MVPTDHAPPPLPESPATPDGATTRNLVSRARAGETEAFSLLVKTYRDRLFRFSLRITRQREDAEDVCQRTFVAAWRHLDKFDPTRPFENWVFGIAYKESVKVASRRRPTEAVPEIACEREAPDAATMSAETPLWDFARTALTQDRYHLLWMHYGEDLPVAEIARITGRTGVAVKVHLFRARAQLRAALDKSTGSPTLKTSISSLS